MATVKLNPQQAQWIADLLAPNMTVKIDGTTVTLSALALQHLADLDDESDGHYDGTCIWIGGSEYRVRRPVGAPAKAGRHYRVRLTGTEADAIRAAGKREGINNLSDAVATFALRQVRAKNGVTL